ncbi:MAG: hypothetical protein ACP5GY_01000 [Vulcanisaeta sp.]
MANHVVLYIKELEGVITGHLLSTSLINYLVYYGGVVMMIKY